MANLYIPIAIPGSGKTTWTKSVLVNPFCQRVSTDDIRDKLHPDQEYTVERNNEVFAQFHKDVGMWLGLGRSVIADATNLKASRRSQLIEIAEQNRCVDIHYIVFTNVDQAILRNARRKAGRVPDTDMLDMVAQYETALKDIEVEPVESITYISRLT